MLNRLSKIFYTATTTPDTTIFAIGDTHGYLDALKALCAKIDTYKAKHPNKHIIEVFLGDYVNRGPQSKEVLDFLIERSRLQDGVKRVFLAGNHDVAFRRILKETHKHKTISTTEEMFYDFGGPETLASYGVPMRTFRFPERGSTHHIVRGSSLYIDRTCLNIMRDELVAQVPASHLLFLEKMKTSYSNGKYLFVHAGIDPSVPLAEQDRDYVRGLNSKARKFPNQKGRLEDDMVVVHGHTIAPEPYHTRNQIGVDTGVYKPGHGNITCAVLTGQDVKFLKARTHLPPFEENKSPAMVAARGFVLN